MSARPLSRLAFIKRLRKLGFIGPFVRRGKGTKHQYMQNGDLAIRVPNSHGGKDIGIELQKFIVEKQAGINFKIWSKLK